MKLRGAFLLRKRELSQATLLPACRALTMLCLLIPACQTTRVPEPLELPPRAVEFQPATYIAPIHLEQGRYPDLFTPTSYAVWVGPEVAALKRDKAESEGEPIAPGLDAAAADIGANYVVVECHMDSIFADMSVAYDVVGFRGIDVYVRMPDGRKVSPSQKVIGAPIEEEQRQALRLFRRTNLVIFPKRDLRTHPGRGAATASLELVMEGYGSTFHFEWPAAPLTAVPPWTPTSQETAQALRLGFTSLYGKLRQLAHRFD